MRDILTIRPARAGDAEIFQALENDAGRLFETVDGLTGVADADNLPVERYEALITRDMCWAAVDAPGDCVGFVCTSREDGALHVWEMAVRRTHQRQGLGRRLMETAIDAARAAGLTTVTLTTFRDVAWNAPFYARLGFVEAGSGEADERLRGLLREEAARGLPMSLRCAMRLSIA